MTEVVPRQAVWPITAVPTPVWPTPALPTAVPKEVGAGRRDGDHLSAGPRYRATRIPSRGWRDPAPDGAHPATARVESRRADRVGRVVASGVFERVACLNSTNFFGNNFNTGSS